MEEENIKKNMIKDTETKKRKWKKSNNNNKLKGKQFGRRKRGRRI
jgi:hypothetical protein